MEETEKAHRYVIDLDTADGDNRSLAATIAIIPMPQLNVRSISSREILPLFSSH